MKMIVLLISIFASMQSLAQDKGKALTKAQTQQLSHVQMHEHMVKAHQQAADCLKSGKSDDECRTMFQKMCQESGDHGMCGAGPMMHGRGKRF